MNRRNLTTMAPLGLAVATALPQMAFAQSNPFVGTWQLNLANADSCDCGQSFQLIADSHSNPLRTAFQSIADSIPMIADSSLIDSFKGSFGSV